MADNLSVTWDKFFQQRTQPLWERFSGYYRSLVVETNDPLRMHRVRFKCPDLHDWGLAADDCPWAVAAFDFGLHRQGRWSHPCIGDWVWITFERNHPNAPIWVGMAAPTRRKFYAYPGVYGVTPVPVNLNGEAQSAPQDYDTQYLPQDGRPMSHGWQDRYGNLDITCSVGFYPTEHAVAPPPPDYDAVQQGQFDAAGSQPRMNQPDVKHMTRLTKYGNMLILGDQGYDWQREFQGDFVQDEQYEIRRWKYLQRLINEDQPDSSGGQQHADQRRLELKSRYGTKIEIRDVGWAQSGPIASQTRSEEYGDGSIISRESQDDFRWLKLRTKAGMLLQMYDKGAHPQNDLFISRPLIDEVAHKTEREDQYWADRDARFIRIVTRYGYKIVLDDRGSSPTDAEGQEFPTGNGILLKGRRTGAANMETRGTGPRGFYIEFNENHELNHLTIGSPLGQVFEQNDRYEYIMLATSMGREYAMPWRKLQENEFLLTPTMALNPEETTHHLKLDHENEYIRLKTRAGRGDFPYHIVNTWNCGRTNQGLEARDGADGGQGDGAWVELVDSDERALWLSHKYRRTTWRGARRSNLVIYMDEDTGTIVISNENEDNDNPKIRINCKGDVDVRAQGNINLTSEKDINLSAAQNINLTSGFNTHVSITPQNQVTSTAKYYNWASAADFAITAGEAPTGSAGAPGPIVPGTEAKYISFIETVGPLSPSDRGKTYNGPFEAADPDVVQHRT